MSGHHRLAITAGRNACKENALRPVLAKWHPLLQDWENRKPADVSAAEHERQWERAAELRQELSRVREALRQYATLLEQAAGVPSLVIDRPA